VASLAQLTEGQLGVDYPPLESLGHVDTIDRDTLPLLLRLPTLTELQALKIELDDVRPLLAALPLLTFLSVKPRPENEVAEWWRGVAQALQLCPQLTSLELHGAYMLFGRRALVDEHLAAIVRAVPRLQSLMVNDASLSSLRCFAETPHLGHTLQRLRLGRESGRIHPSELKHLRPLRALRVLEVKSLSGWTFSSIRGQLTPGHFLFDWNRWPHLRTVELSSAELRSD